MSNLAGSIISALVAFVFTNLDDLILLTVFFGEAKANQVKHDKEKKEAEEQAAEAAAAIRAEGGGDNSLVLPPVLSSKSAFNRWHVACGQVLGFTALILISLIGFLVGAFVRKEYIGLLGFLPFLIGAYKLYEIVQEECCSSDDEEEEEGKDKLEAGNGDPAASSSPTAVAAVVRFHYAESIGMSEEAEDEEEEENAKTAEEEPQSIASQIELESAVCKPVMNEQAEDTNIERPSGQPNAAPAKSLEVVTPQGDVDESEEPNPETEMVDNALTVFFGKCARYVLHPHTWRVLTVTIANGADNISIYVPLFASADPGQIVVILIVFYILLLLWCAASYLLLLFPPISKAIEKYGEWIVPIALMAVGVYILWSADCIDLVN